MATQQHSKHYDPQARLKSVLDRLDDVKECKGGFTALCPAHDDKTSSLSISLGDNGKILLKCHAGCEWKPIVEALELEASVLFPPRESNRRSSRLGRIVKTYDYKDENGELLFQVVRYETKEFRQRRPDGNGGWQWNLDGVRRVLYRLPELTKADPEEPVIVCEGEKDVDRLRERGFIATTNAAGAGKFHLVDSTPLHGRDVVIIPDNDEAGQKHAEQVASILHEKAESIRVLNLPDLPDKGDVSDWLDSGSDAAKLCDLMSSAPSWTPIDNTNADQPTSPSQGEPQQRRSQADKLIEIARDDELFHAPGDLGSYATIEIDEHLETWAIKSSRYRKRLLQQFWRQYEKSPSSQAITDALGVIESLAQFEGSELDVHVRVAEHEDSIFLDLGNEAWAAVHIRPDGWNVVNGDRVPVKFIRSVGMLPLPTPEQGGDIGLLRPLVNVASDSDWVLLLGWLLGALRASGPFPPLDLTGEAGSAQTTIGQMVRGLVDPNKVPLRAVPRDVRDLMISAEKSHVLAFDNLSHLPPWLSDALCRIATGGGFATRELYSDREEVIFDAIRPVILTGIENVVTRGDLVDRSLSLTLKSISDSDRKTEQELNRDYASRRPAILGGLLSAVSLALKNLPDTALDRLPRMADFARWVVAGESGLGLTQGQFMNEYDASREDANLRTVEHSPIGEPLLGLIYAHEKGFAGTARELLDELSADRHSDRKTRDRRDWPKTPEKLANILRRLAPHLRQIGIDVSMGVYLDRKRRSVIVIEKVAATQDTRFTGSTNALHEPGTAASCETLFNSNQRNESQDPTQQNGDEGSEPGDVPGVSRVTRSDSAESEGGDYEETNTSDSVDEGWEAVG
jgi:hypothetical protein